MAYEIEKQNTVEAYQRIADNFNRRNTVSIYQKELDVFTELLGNNKKLLEIGCGTGRDAVELVRRGFTYVGTDASEAMLAVAREKLPAEDFRVGDLYALEFPDGTFDGFWAAAVFLHVPKPELTQALMEARRVLKEGGVGFISVKEKTHMDEGVIAEEKGGGIKRYFSFFTEEELKGYLEQASFKVLAMDRNRSESDGTVWLYAFVQKQAS